MKNIFLPGARTWKIAEEIVLLSIILLYSILIANQKGILSMSLPIGYLGLFLLIVMSVASVVALVSGIRYFKKTKGNSGLASVLIGFGFLINIFVLAGMIMGLLFLYLFTKVFH